MSLLALLEKYLFGSLTRDFAWFLGYTISHVGREDVIFFVTCRNLVSVGTPFQDMKQDTSFHIFVDTELDFQISYYSLVGLCGDRPLLLQS